MNKIKAVIFDMDGVIFDSERVYMETWKIIGEKYGLDGIEDTCRACIGVNAEETKKIFLSRHGEDVPYDEYRKELRSIMDKRYEKEKFKIKSGVHEILEYLRSNGIKTALASSTGEKRVKAELEDAGILGYFDSVTGGDNVKRSKPMPDIFLLAAQKINEKSENCFVIEDSYNGIRAGYAAGMRVIMVPDLIEPDEQIKKMTEIILPTLNDVLEYFKKIQQ